MYCRTCHEFEEDVRLPDYLETYVKNVDPELRTEETIYKKRLEICNQCSHKINGMCYYCGCFVMVRAAKNNQKCPNPTGDCWNIPQN